MAQSATESENKALIRRWFDEVWNQGKRNVIDELRAPDAIATGLGEPNTKFHGPAAFEAFFSNLRGAIPDLHVNIEDILAEGDKVAVRLSAEGTHSGRGFGAEPTGRHVQFTCITISRIAGGKIVQGWNNLDQLGLLTQLGLIPENHAANSFLAPRPE